MIGVDANEDLLLEAPWRTRFERMKRLRDFCGPDFEQVQEEFLDCLTRADHESAE